MNDPRPTRVFYTRRTRRRMRQTERARPSNLRRSNQGCAMISRSEATHRNTCAMYKCTCARCVAPLCPPSRERRERGNSKTRCRHRRHRAPEKLPRPARVARNRESRVLRTQSILESRRSFPRHAIAGRFSSEKRSEAYDFTTAKIHRRRIDATRTDFFASSFSFSFFLFLGATSRETRGMNLRVLVRAWRPRHNPTRRKQVSG